MLFDGLNARIKLTIVMRYLENRRGNPLKLGIAIKCQSHRNDAFRGLGVHCVRDLAGQIGEREGKQLGNYMNILGVSFEENT